MIDNIIVALVLISISLIVITIILAFIAWSLVTVYNFLSLFDRPYKEPKHNEPIYEEPTSDEPEHEEPKHKNKKTIKYQALNPKL